MATGVTRRLAALVLVIAMAAAACARGGWPGPGGGHHGPPFRGEIDLTLTTDPTTCDPLGGDRCMLPFPNDHFTVDDPSTATGRRVQLAPDATPANRAGVHVDPTELNRNDGFSPGTAIAVLLPGVDPDGQRPGPDHRHGRVARPPGADRDRRRRHRRAPSVLGRARQPRARSRAPAAVRPPGPELPRGPPLHRGRAQGRRRRRPADRADRRVPGVSRPAADRRARGRGPPRPHGRPVPHPAARPRPAARPHARLGLHGGERREPLRAPARHARRRLHRAGRRRARLRRHRRPPEHPGQPGHRGAGHVPGAELPDRRRIAGHGAQQRRRAGIVADSPSATATTRPGSSARCHARPPTPTARPTPRA